MKKLIVGAAVAVLTAACGRGGSSQPLDASLDAQLLCDPIAQTGCMASEKCTWVIDANANPATGGGPIGHVGCAPVDPSAMRGMACTAAVAEVNEGADHCASGEICIAGVCKQICDPQLAPGAGAGACDPTHACLSYRGVFEASSAPIAGVCEVGCLPLTQQRATDKAEACGSDDPAAPTATCVPTSEELKSFACAPVQTLMATDRMPPVPPADNPTALVGSGCAPGFLPFSFDDGSGVMTTLCSGLCAPVKMDSTIAMTAPPDQKPYGDTSAPGKLPFDMKAVAGHATCLSGVKGSIPASDPQGDDIEDCRFIWAPLEIASNPSNPTPVDTPYNNQLGVCFPYSKLKTVDTNNDGKPDAFEKSCKDLGTAPDPIYGTAQDAGCYPLSGFPVTTGSTSPAAPPVRPHRLGSFRPAYGIATVARPVLE
ncbi:MAG TPA: hypothetical protein VHT91_37635 [Kofleriaceae bacterium]|nr:hypothetical protein [Kofleriaceae bacterium]